MNNVLMDARPMPMLLVVALATGWTLQGCGGETESPLPRLVVEGSWARAMPLPPPASEAGANSAVYMVLRNQSDTPDRLTGGETGAAAGVEVHESSMDGDVMRMRRVAGVEIPGRGEVELRPGGFHLMLLDLHHPLVEGSVLELTLEFEVSDDLVVEVPIRSHPPA